MYTDPSGYGSKAPCDPPALADILLQKLYKTLISEASCAVEETLLATRRRASTGRWSCVCVPNVDRKGPEKLPMKGKGKLWTKGSFSPAALREAGRGGGGRSPTVAIDGRARTINVYGPAKLSCKGS